MATPVVLTAAVEGLADEALLKRICDSVGASVGQVHGRYGKSYILKNLNGYNHSAQFRHWVVLVDLDYDGACVPEVLPRWLPTPSRLMRLRVAVRELEAWLLADTERIAKFLGVAVAEIPADPDGVADPKRLMVQLARGSRRRAIREDMTPNIGSGQPVGPAYTSRMIEFIQSVESGWRPDVAAGNSDSLRRCISAISNLAEQEFGPR
jgi:hypothetical protein